jgi:pyruvate,water dikinase
MDVLVPLTSAETDLAMVGGKAVNLLRMTRAGLPVPSGFVVPTPAYRMHVQRAGLDAVIVDQLATVDGRDTASLERASEVIRSAFAGTGLDPGLAAELDAAYDALDDGPGPAAVAVRSSATAEDLPDLSFAGQ